MAWYEITVLFICIVSIVPAVAYGLFYDVKRIKANIRMIAKQQQFYEIASEWFYYHMGDKP